MQKRKSKKILKYFFLLLLVGSINNINLNDLKLHNIHNVNIIGLDNKDKRYLLNKVDFNLYNIFSINKDNLIKEIESNALVEKYFILKKYPSSLNINIEKTKFLAKINKNEEIFYLGSNGKFIKNDFSKKQLPFIIGEPRKKDIYFSVADTRKFNKCFNWRPKYNNLNYILKTALNWEKK